MLQNQDAKRNVKSLRFFFFFKIKTAGKICPPAASRLLYFPLPDNRLVAKKSQSTAILHPHLSRATPVLVAFCHEPKSQGNPSSQEVSRCQQSMTQLMFATVTTLLHHQESVTALKYRKVINLRNTYQYLLQGASWIKGLCCQGTSWRSLFMKHFRKLLCVLGLVARLK